MQPVDRAGFQLWYEGIILEFRNGVGIIVRERDCIAAEDALNRGETVVLTDGGRVVSEMKLQDGVFAEMSLLDTEGGNP